MSTNSTDDQITAIKKVGEEFFAGTNAGDLDRRMATMASDVIVMPSNRPPIVGREEMRRLSAGYQAMFDEQCLLTYDEVETAGDWAFVRATVNATRTTRSSGETETLSLKNLWIIRRQADGQWKFWRIMHNSNSPPA